MAPTGCGTEVGTTSEPVPLGPSELGDGTKHGKNPVRTEDDGWMDGWMLHGWKSTRFHGMTDGRT